MAGILGKVKNASKIVEIKNHPVQSENMELKIHYLNGLALMMNVDEEIHKAEKDYIRSLIKTFDLDDNLISRFIDFAEDPEDELIDEMFAVLSEKDSVRYNFLLDSVMLSQKDGTIHENETELLALYSDKLSINNDTFEIIKEAIDVVISKSVERTKGFYINYKEVYNFFEYMFINKDLDVKEEVEKEIIQRREYEERRRVNEIKNRPIQEKIDDLEARRDRLSDKEDQLWSQAIAYDPDDNIFDKFKKDPNIELKEVERKIEDLDKQIERLENQLIFPNLSN